jgi:hypothetical protein
VADWKKIMDTVAPWIGAAAAGGVPGFVAMAATQVGQALGQTVGASGDAIAKAISGATPDQMLALKNADAEFAIKMQQLGFDNTQKLEQLAVNDRDSARKRQALMQDWTPTVLGVMVVASFFVVVYMFMHTQLPDIGGYRDVMMVLMGSLSAAFTQVLNFFFGSSASSNVKNDIIGALNKK